MDLEQLDWWNVLKSLEIVQVIKNKIFVLKNSIKWSYNIVIGFATSSPTRSLDPLARLLHSLACSTKLDCGHPALTLGSTALQSGLWGATITSVG